MTAVGPGLLRVIVALALVGAGVVLGVLGQGLGWVIVAAGAFMVLFFFGRLGRPNPVKRGDPDDQLVDESDYEDFPRK